MVASPVVSIVLDERLCESETQAMAALYNLSTGSFRPQYLRYTFALCTRLGSVSVIAFASNSSAQCIYPKS